MTAALNVDALGLMKLALIFLLGSLVGGFSASVVWSMKMGHSSDGDDTVKAMTEPRDKEDLALVKDLATFQKEASFSSQLDSLEEDLDEVTGMVKGRSIGGERYLDGLIHKMKALQEKVSDLEFQIQDHETMKHRGR